MFRAEFQAAVDQDQNQSRSILSHQVSDLMEKLKFLNYESSLLRELRMKPLNRYYFLNSTNPGEQFFVFVSMCAWLIRKTGRNFEQPQEFDEPSAVITKIVRVLQEMDIPTDFQSNKLIPGAGPFCIYVLDCLATLAFKVAKNQQLERFAPKKEDETAAEFLDNDAEIILEKVEEEQNAMLGNDSDDDEKNAIMNLNVTSRQNVVKGMKFDTLVDSENWRLELERVLPQLKVFVKSDPRDWRAHLEQMKMLRTNIETASDDTKAHLKKLENETAYVMEKIESREKYLNNDLKDLVGRYKLVSNELSQTKLLFKDQEMEKLDQERILLDLINEIEAIKSQMEMRGNAMTDGSPVVNIKRAIANITEEISDLDLQIGVLDHAINTENLKLQIQNIEMEPLKTLL